MPQTHEDVVREIFRGWATGDFRSAAHFDEHVTYVVRRDFPEFGVFVGLAEVGAFMRRFLEQWERVTFDATDFEVIGDTVLVGVTQHSTGAMSGVEGDARMFMLFTFRGPKIVRMESVLHETDARAALRLPGDAASFEKPADSYDRFVGRYGRSLARALIARIGVRPGWSALDVGCGPGALTAVLAETVGVRNVAAVDPSEPFQRACSQRVPGADVRLASAERLPFAADSFDATLSQLVVNFLPDAAAGVREMRRVTRPGGLIAAAVWDYAGEMTMLRAFWDAAGELDPTRARSLDEGTRMPYCQPDPLAALLTESGLENVFTDSIVVHAAYEDFDDLWDPFTTGVGPAGAYCASLSNTEREALKLSYYRRLGSPDGGFELTARAWLACGTA